MAQMLEYDSIDDTIIDELWKNEVEYFGLMEKCKILNEKLNLDEKTGLLRYSNNYLSDIIKTASRIMGNMNYPYIDVSFVRFDIDDFSVFNDRYGHDLGDEVLIKSSGIIKEYSRPTDYVIRFGGEEIDVILPSTTLEGAAIYTKKIMDELQDIKFCYNENSEICVTMSAGISSSKIKVTKNLDCSEIDWEYRILQKKADDALYESKLLGKKRYSIYSDKRNNEYASIRSEYNRMKLSYHS